MKNLFVVLVMGACLQFAWKHFHPLANGHVNAEFSAAAISDLASTVKASDVVMYSTNECAYCAQAKSWLQQNGFAFTECNMSVSIQCEHEFKRYGATGTPYLLVKGHQMKNGFDSDEFLTALK